MTNKTTLTGVITIECENGEVYTIEQDGNLFFITTNKGYNGFEGDGDVSIESALRHVKTLIKNTNF